MSNEVCEDCESDPIYGKFDSTSLTSSVRTFEEYPERYSNPACPNFHGGGLGGFTIPRSEWEKAH